MADLTGQVLGGRYRVEAFLGRGGMADVYKVWDQQRAVFLALKVLHADLAEDQVFLDRFEREAQTLEVLQHPNIVRFYGLEKSGHSAFILMDFIDGLTLRQEIFLNKRGLLPERIFEIMQPVCAALFYAHQMNLVHCDIKPANIMMHRNGTVYLTDFGIARMTEGNTQTLGGAGTPAYMAPEQFDRKVPTLAADVYSLGVVLFEMLTGGQRPFTGDASQTSGTTAQRIIWEKHHQAAPSPRKYNPNVSAEMEAVVLRCLEKSPRKRFGSALDLMQALEVATSGIQDNDEAQTRIDLDKKPSRPGRAKTTHPHAETEGKAPPPAEKPPDGAKRKPAPEQNQASGEKAAPAAGKHPEAAPARKPDLGQPAKARAQTSAEKPAPEAGKPSQPDAGKAPSQAARPLLETAKRALEAKRTQSEAGQIPSEAGKARPAAGNIPPPESGAKLEARSRDKALPPPPAAPSVSARAVTPGLPAEIKTARKKEEPGSAAHIEPHGKQSPEKPGKTDHSAKHPPGKSLFEIVRLKSRAAKILVGALILAAFGLAILITPEKTPAYTQTFFPSATFQPTSTRAQETHSAPLITPAGELLPPLAQPTLANTPQAQVVPTATGGSNRLAFASNRGGSIQVWIMTVSDPENRHQVTDEPGGACQPAWSPDGTQLAYTTPCAGWSVYFPGSTIKIIRLEDGKVTPLPVKVPGVAGAFDPAWSPEGTTLAYTALIGKNTEIRAINLADQKVSILANRGTKNAQPAWSRDGQYIAFISRDVRNWDELWCMRANGDSQEVLGRSGMFAEPEWTPDGTHILVSMNPGNNIPLLAVIDRSNPTQGAATLLSDTFNLSHSSISPDGQWIAFWTTRYKNSPEIILSSMDGKDVRPLTNDMLRNFQPAWSPR